MPVGVALIKKLEEVEPRLREVLLENEAMKALLTNGCITWLACRILIFGLRLENNE